MTHERYHPEGVSSHPLAAITRELLAEARARGDRIISCDAGVVDSVASRLVIAVWDEQRGLLVHEDAGVGTTGGGELAGIERAVALCRADERALIVSDSLLAVSWVLEQSEPPASLRGRVAMLSERLRADGLALAWVPREENPAGVYLEQVRAAQRAY